MSDPGSRSDNRLTRYLIMKKVVENAIHNKKIFTLVGNYPSIRASLDKRGWVEKFYYNPKRNMLRSAIPCNLSQLKLEQEPGTSIEDDKGCRHTTVRLATKWPSWLESIGDTSHRGYIALDHILTEDQANIYFVLSHMKKTCHPNFIWTRRRDQLNFEKLKSDQIVNFFPVAEFTTKVGLCEYMNKLHFSQEIDSFHFFPRCFNLSVYNQRKAFIEDYRTTTCICMLKLVVQSIHLGVRTSLPFSNQHNVVPARAIELALNHCKLLLKSKFEDDFCTTEAISLTESDWSLMLGWHFQVINEKATLERARDFYDQSIIVLNRLRNHWPQIDMDGVQNIWIVKPGAKSRGIAEERRASLELSAALVFVLRNREAGGIKIYQNLDKILHFGSGMQIGQLSGYVVQKYIERPLLIHFTKFDIRQWFLVTDLNPLTIYFYKDCYIRFCSKPFSLKDRTPAAHLCNNAIQQQYINSNSPRMSLIPKELMWNIDEFKQYLKIRGKLDKWDKFIYPGMKNSVIATLQTVQHKVKLTNRCFELYGADFMVSRDFHPWLLEINSNPCLAPTTKVTAKLGSTVLEDLLKVVIDRAESESCPIGRFECVYKQNEAGEADSVADFLRNHGVAIRNPSLENPFQWDVS